MRGNSEALSVLIKIGAKVEGWSSYKNDPLYVAAFNGHQDCVQALLATGVPIITGTKHGFSALNCAAQNGHVEILQYLLHQGVSVHAESSPFGGTPLLAAARNGQLACMLALLDAGADMNRPDCDGEIALYYAARCGELAALELLLACGAKVQGWSSCESDPLCIAAVNGHLACGQALLAASTPIATGRKYGYSALNRGALAAWTFPSPKKHLC